MCIALFRRRTRRRKTHTYTVVCRNKVKCGSRCSLHETLEKLFFFVCEYILFFIIYPSPTASRKLPLRASAIGIAGKLLLCLFFLLFCVQFTVLIFLLCFFFMLLLFGSFVRMLHTAEKPLTISVLFGRTPRIKTERP